jgi:hypothetical protein
VHSRVVTWAVALAGAALVLRLGSPAEDVYWSDFNTEAWPAFQRLIEGDLRGFLAASPVAYGGSMVIRAPFAALAGPLGLEEPGVFRLGVIPCLLALAALAVHLARRATDPRWWLLVIPLALGPLAWQAVHFGHPEELLATAFAVAAVLAALKERAILAGALLGLAIASKQWAVLAVLPTVLAAPRHRPRLLAAAGASGAAILLPIVLADPGAYAAAQQAVTSSARWFRPRQLWWPFGVPAPADMGAPPGATITPEWLAQIAKPLIVALALPLSALWARRRSAPADALLLLGLLMLCRCVLDPWNVVYYHLPLVIALLAWEVVSGRRIPVLALATTVAVWLTFESYDAAYSDGPWIAYLAWTLPLGAYLAHRLYRPSVAAARVPVPVPA